jgi:hypothetical protein
MATFEQFDHEELEPILKENEKLAVAAVLMTKADISSLWCTANNALAEINTIQSNLQDRTSKIDPQLKADIIAGRVMSMRREMGPIIDKHLQVIRDCAATAKAQMRFWTPWAVRIRASFDAAPDKDAAVRMAWIRRLERTPAFLLEDFAALASATGSLALGHTIETELFAREGASNDCTRPQRDAIMKFVSSIPNSSVEVTNILTEITYIPDNAAMAASGKVNPITLIKNGLRAAS